MAADVVLINPAALQASARDAAVRKQRRSYPPLGLLSVAAHLISHGYQPIVIDFFRDSTVSKGDFQARLVRAAGQPFAVGISTYTETCHDAWRIAAAVRETFAETPIVLGGPHATTCPDESLRDCPCADYIIRAEGESTFIELLEHLRHPAVMPLDAIRGLVYRSDGEVRVNEPRSLVTHLDCLPLPPHHLVREVLEPEGDRDAVIMTSRGCPGQCIFCASRALSGHRYRMHSAEWLFSEMYRNRGDGAARSLAIMDDTFLVDRSRLRTFCRYLQEVGLDISWSCRSRADTIREETMELIASVGCRSIHIGVESGDDEVLRSIGKGVTVDQILEAIFIIKKHGIRPECSFMIGHHSDTRETINRTILLARWIRDRDIGFSIVRICTPLPGTRLHAESAALGLRFLTHDWRDYDLNTVIYETENFAAEDLKCAQYFFDIESFRNPDSCFGMSGRSQELLEAKLEALGDRIDALSAKRG